MKIILFFLFIANLSFGQMTAEQIDSLREVRNVQMKTPGQILKKEEIENFIGLDFFEFSKSYQVIAKFKKKKGKKFSMPTSNGRITNYRRYGYLYFTVNNEPCTLAVYQNLELKKIKEYKNYLFLPFRDNTNAEESYGGGRYLDLQISDGETMILDFNLAYNPYCSYTHRYSCPIPPTENTLKISILAGEKIPFQKELKHY